MNGLAAALLLWAAAGGAATDPVLDEVSEAEHVRTLTEAGTILPLAAILERAGRDFPGRVIEIEFDEEHGRYIYELEIVDAEGRVWEVEFDAATAEIIESEQEDD